MARPSKSAPARAPVDSSTSTAPDTADTSVFNVDFARTCLNASLSASQSTLEFFSELQQVQAQAMRELEKSVGSAIQMTAQADGLQGLFAVQAKLARENLSRTTQGCNDLFAKWLATEAQLVEQAQAQTTNLTRGLIEDRSATQKGSAAAPQSSAVALYEDAQAALTHMTQMWVDAVGSGATQHH